MIKLTVKFLVIISFSVVLLGWTTPLAIAQEKREASSSDVGSEQKSLTWQELRRAESGFLVQMPGEAREVSRTITPQPETEITIQMFMVSLEEGRLAVVAGYHDVQEMPADDNKRKEILDGGIKGTLVNVVGHMLSHQEVEVDGAPGRRFTYRGNRKGREIAGHSQLVLNGKRVYQLSVIRMATMDADEELVEKFFSSFQLVEEDN